MSEGQERIYTNHKVLHSNSYVSRTDLESFLANAHSLYIEKATVALL